MQRLNRLSFFIIKGLCYYLITLVTVALSVAAENSYGPIQSGDILWNVAQSVRPGSSVNRYQTMLALFQANPDAFKIPCNLNSLIVGKHLLIPSLAEIEAINPTLAKNIIDQHNAEWKNYRQYHQPIRCPSSPTTVAIEQSAPVLQNKVKPEHPTEPIAVTMETTVSIPQKISVSHRKESVVPMTTSWQFLLSQPILWVIITFMVILFLSSTILVIRLLKGFIRKWFIRQQECEQSQEDLPTTLLPNTVSEKATTDLPDDPEKITINKKLDNARELLAKGETQTVKSQLLEVMDQGNQNQRREARQLLEINQQMSTLELNLLQVQRVTTPSKTPALPENKSEIFKLVDKIFSVLDQELNAKGQLIEAYHDRHKPELFSATEYENLKNSEEKILVEQNDALQAQELKTIRYL